MTTTPDLTALHCLTVEYALQIMWFLLKATNEGLMAHICQSKHCDALQTARYLLKALMAAAKGQKPGGGAAFLANAEAEAGRRCGVTSADGWLDLQAQLAALRWFSSNIQGTPRWIAFVDVD